MAELLSLDNPVFANFAFYAAVVIVKMMIMSFWTSTLRMSKSVFANPEDVKGFGKKSDDKVNLGDQDVERVRRNHLNDMENIPPFVFLGFFYVLIKPSPFIALWHFRAFAISRILHTICYQWAIPQPSRATCFTGGAFICLSMAVQILAKAKF